MADQVDFGLVESGGNINGKIIAVRVQDIDRQIWYNWDVGTWDAPPKCNPGPNKLYVAVWAENLSDADGNITLQLVNTANGTVLAEKTEFVAVGNGVGIEWTGSMPTINFNLTCMTSTDAVQFQITPTGTPSTYNVTVQAGTGGTTTPAPGVYSISAGQPFNATATPSEGYYFSHWTKNGANIGSANQISIPVISNMTLSAVFTTTPPSSYLWLLILGLAGAGAATAVYLKRRK